jgi:ribosomal-protein-alanine N-acetyltransferase
MSALRPPLVIRPSCEEDLPEIHQLDNEVFENTPYPLFVLRQFFDMYGDHLLVLDDGVSLHGYVLASAPRNTRSWILGLGVSPHLRGKGMGRRLLVEILHRLRCEGVREVRLTVDPDYQPAIDLYRSLAFTPAAEGRRRDYFGPDEDRLLMILSL